VLRIIHEIDRVLDFVRDTGRKQAERGVRFSRAAIFSPSALQRSQNAMQSRKSS
jgi:hypothetical protein